MFELKKEEASFFKHAQRKARYSVIGEHALKGGQFAMRPDAVRPVQIEAEPPQSLARLRRGLQQIGGAHDELHIFETRSTGRDEPPESPSGGKFRYVREVVGENDAVLEFMTEMDGIVVNGVDLIRWNDAGRIVDFKVLIRPLKAVNKVHAMMAGMLERMKPS